MYVSGTHMKKKVFCELSFKKGKLPGRNTIYHNVFILSRFLCPTDEDIGDLCNGVAKNYIQKI